MKKMYQLLALMAVLFAMSSCELDRKKILTVDQLPEAAQTYIKENMPDAKVLYVKKERKNLKTRYEVKFDNKMELEFDSDGDIYDIEVDDWWIDS